MEHAMVARRVGDGFIEHGDIGLIVIIKRLGIDIGHQGTGWSDGLEQGLHNHIDAANNRPGRSNASVNHDDSTRQDTQPAKIIDQGIARDYHNSILQGGRSSAGSVSERPK